MTPQHLYYHISALYLEWQDELPNNWQDDLWEYVQRIRVSVPQNVSHVLDPEDRLVEEYLLLTQ